ncbi:MAG: hypothetical protein ACYTG2_08835 [Planctomycetota bacterium]|jgi:hypothetical protein
MATLTSIIGLLLIGGFAEEELRQPATVTASLPDAVIRVPMDHSNRRIEVPVFIDGQGPFLFQLDTSCESAVVLDPELASLLAATAATARASSTADEASLADRPDESAADAERPSLALARLDLGDANFLDLSAEVRELNDSAAPGVHGVLGLPLFENLLLTIDYTRSQLVLSRGSLARDAVDVFPLLGPGRAPHVPLQVGGRVWPARIDTGDAENVTFPVAAARDVRTQRRPVILGGKVGGPEPQVRGARLADTLLVAGRGYQQLPVLFAEDATEPRLGYGLLAHFALTFDQRQGLVRFGLSAPTEVMAQERGTPAMPEPVGAGAWAAVHTAVSGFSN